MYKLDLYYNIGDLIVDQNWMFNICVCVCVKEKYSREGDLTVIANCQL